MRVWISAATLEDFAAWRHKHGRVSWEAKLDQVTFLIISGESVATRAKWQRVELNWSCQGLQTEGYGTNSRQTMYRPTIDLFITCQYYWLCGWHIYKGKNQSRNIDWCWPKSCIRAKYRLYLVDILSTTMEYKNNNWPIIDQLPKNGKVACLAEWRVLGQILLHRVTCL